MKEKKIIITGASRGIGKEIALDLSQSGHSLILLAKNAHPLDNTFKTIKKFSKESRMYLCNIANFEKLRDVYLEIQKDFGKIDVLINNAGIQHPIGSLIDVDFFEWVENIEVNLLGTVLLTKLVLQDMVKVNKGKIINFSGGGSTSPRPNFSAYATSKTAIVRFTETIAEEVNAYNIEINAVAPGAINTSMLEEVIKAGYKAGREYKDALKRRESGGTDIKFIKKLIRFLISEESNGITGKLISAPWDEWDSLDYREKLRTNKNLATLRRIDNKFFGEI